MWCLPYDGSDLIGCWKTFDAPEETQRLNIHTMIGSLFVRLKKDFAAFHFIASALVGNLQMYKALVVMVKQL